MGKVKKYSSKFNVILLTLYVSIIWIIHIFVNVTDNKEQLIILSLIIFIFNYKAISFVVSKIEKTNFNAKNKKVNPLIFLFFLGFCFLYLFVWYIAYCPGGFSYDSINQYCQSINNEYNDWHPVLHTLIFFKFPLLITGNVFFIILFQIIYFSIILGYMCMVISKHIGIKQACIVLGYIILNPCTAHIVLFPWKDVAFGMFGLLCLIYFFDLYFSNEISNMKLHKIILLAIIIVITTLFRHNACLFTFPIIFSLLFYMKKTHWIKLVFLIVMLLFIVKGPVYKVLNVEAPGNRVTEITGLPLTVIGNVAKEAPEKIDYQLKNFVYTVAPKEKWENYYKCGDFNSLKFTGINSSVIEETGAYEIVKMMFRCFSYSATNSFKALFMLTDMVYDIGNELEDDMQDIYVISNDYDIRYNGIIQLDVFFKIYTNIINNSILRYIITSGSAILVTLVCVMSKLNWKSKESIKKAVVSSCIFIYDFGTMLLLTGPDSRFFYITFLVCPLIILFSLYNVENKEGNL